MKTYLLFTIYDAGILQYYSSIYYYFNKFKCRSNIIVTNSITCSCLNSVSDIHTLLSSSIWICINYLFISFLTGQVINLCRLKMGSDSYTTSTDYGIGQARKKRTKDSHRLMGRERNILKNVKNYYFLNKDMFKLLLLLYCLFRNVLSSILSVQKETEIVFYKLLNQ